jgi:hypothetical protein
MSAKPDINGLLREIQSVLDDARSRSTYDFVIVITELLMCIQGLHYIISEMNRR